jgi:hypothetical protein
MIADTAQTQVDRLDGRTRHAKRLRSLIAGLALDLGHAPSTAENELIRQTAMLICQREAVEAAISRGEPANSAEVTKVAGAITRCISALRGKTSKRNAGGAPSGLGDILRRGHGIG